jgi:uncharacterized protein (TIGR02646 family)
MRKVPRTGASPAALGAKDKSGLTELDRARAHVQSAAAKVGFPFKAYKHDEVRQRLEELFHGKCAYCETFYRMSAPVDIEHFRPKNSVSEDPAHPGYWWIAMAWDNLLPSCLDCNRKRKQHLVASSASLVELRENMKRQPVTQSGKLDSFPIKGGTARLQPEDVAYATEQALLLNPCMDVPEDHLEFVFDGTPPISLVVPRASPAPSERGAVSIQVYGLNRLGLVQERTRVLRHLAFLGDLVLELGELIDELVRPDVALALAGTPAATVARRLYRLLDQTLAEMKAMASPDQPYSAMVRAWLAGFEARLERG